MRYTISRLLDVKPLPSVFPLASKRFVFIAANFTTRFLSMIYMYSQSVSTCSTCGSFYSVQFPGQ